MSNKLELLFSLWGGIDIWVQLASQLAIRLLDFILRSIG
jgi:hypothetical protein